jgi:hypothetical protein
MVILRNSGIFLIVTIAVSCNLHAPVSKSKFIGTYVASTPAFVDTLVIYKNGTYFHVIHGTADRSTFSQIGKWRATVMNYYDLLDWRTDSTVNGGADIIPQINRLTGSVTFAYPLVTAEDIDYVKTVSQ